MEIVERTESYRASVASPTRSASVDSVAFPDAGPKKEPSEMFEFPSAGLKTAPSVMFDEEGDGTLASGSAPANGVGSTRPRILALSGHCSNKEITQLQLDNLKLNHENTDIVFMDGLMEVRACWQMRFLTSHVPPPRSKSDCCKYCPPN